MRVPRPDHEKWIREHFPEELKKEDFDYLFWGLYYLEDGLTVMQVGDRRPDEVLYKAKNEEDLKWWLLDFFCYRHADSNVLKHEKNITWRWCYDDVKNNHWRYIEHRHYDYNTLENQRLVRYDLYLKNLKRASFPEDYFRTKVEECTDIMNLLFQDPHWGYDYENLRFIEISDSVLSDYEKFEYKNPKYITKVVD